MLDVSGHKKKKKRKEPATAEAETAQIRPQGDNPSARQENWREGKNIVEWVEGRRPPSPLFFSRI